MNDDIPTYEIRVERVLITSKARSLDDKWKIEIDPEPLCLYGLPETKWQKFCRWVKYLFVKNKIEKL